MWGTSPPIDVQHTYNSHTHGQVTRHTIRTVVYRANFDTTLSFFPYGSAERRNHHRGPTSRKKERKQRGNSVRVGRVWSWFFFSSKRSVAPVIQVGVITSVGLSVMRSESAPCVPIVHSGHGNIENRVSQDCARVNKLLHVAGGQVQAAT